MRTCGYLTLLFFFGSSAKAGVVIDIDYTGPTQYQSAFTNAANTWESLLLGYQDGVVQIPSSGSSYNVGQTVSTIFVTANLAVNDGVGGILGSAGPTAVARDQSGFWLATDSTMTFDSDDIDVLFNNGSLDSLILHELGHSLGFGTVWALNGVTNLTGDEFIGAEATAIWQSEFGQTGTPDIETEGGPGTAGGHWNENLDGSGLTGITDSLGRDMRDELMTGWLNPNSFISELTLASFRDIGFTTASATAVPEPGTGGVLVAGLVAAMGWRRRRSQAVT
ncbi:leishmanolysin-related zinc metalloendopeptidase [Rhodopirellula europaea]|uniref:Zinc metalloendopeptidase n=1 Tax=Rhodopirellula europaea SH398 TaxID=1263868 RepID=M5S5U5_9BACT|nr:leishmanolysin-related zinc metalloendopeptidase [Rhodopirellula europaea]EMI27013.1 zinc metalloendopeptidase [Rhodopirellula europaea SH398]